MAKPDLVQRLREMIRDDVPIAEIRDTILLMGGIRVDEKTIYKWLRWGVFNH